MDTGVEEYVPEDFIAQGLYTWIGTDTASQEAKFRLLQRLLKLAVGHAVGVRGPGWGGLPCNVGIANTSCTLSRNVVSCRV